MKNTLTWIFFFSIFISAYMAFLSFSSFKRERNKEFAHLTEFWTAFGLQSIVTYFVSEANPYLLALNMLVWPWFIRVFALLFGDLSGNKFLGRIHFMVLGFAIFLTVALAYFGFNFLFFSLPLTMTFGLLSLILMGKFVRSTTPVRSHFYYTSLISLLAFVVVSVLFPLWATNANYYLYAYSLELLTLIGLAVSTLPLYSEHIASDETKKLEKLITERNEQLFSQSKYAELGTMSAGIAHEINNPLAIIQARTTQLLRSLRTQVDADKLSEGLEQILLASERINKTVQGMRDFVHQDQFKSQGEIPVNDLVQDVLAFCGQRLKNHGVNLRVYGVEDLVVFGNKIQLEQVLLNLINNAFEAIEFLPEKWIEISAHQSEDLVRLYFKDSGGGIPKDVVNHMMEPFYTTKSTAKGTGLGLTLAKSIVEKHGGKLKYISDTPHTTFLIELPKRAHVDWGFPLVH